MQLTRRALLRAAALTAGGSLLASCEPGHRARSQAAQDVPPPRRAASPNIPLERVAYGRAAQQFGHLRQPPGPGPHPVVVVIHGGFWLATYDLELMTPACEALYAQGIATWNIEYRRLGDPGGGWPGTFLDVGAAVDHLRTLARRHRLDLKRVATLGHSAGGQLALWTAGRRWIREGELHDPQPLRVRGAVSLAGVVDLERAWALGFESVGRLMGGSPEDYPARYGAGSPAELLPLGVPQVLVHGVDDRIVPGALSVEYRDEAVARGDKVDLVRLPGTGHFELIEPTTGAWHATNEAVQAVVG